MAFEPPEESALLDTVALVTGGTRGVGRAIAAALGRAGAAVAVAGRAEAELREVAEALDGPPGRSLAVVADVTDQKAVAAMVERVDAELGAVDLLVNCAGSCCAIGPSWTVDPDEWWEDVATNLRGSFLCARAVLPGMVARGRGRIVNVASYAGTRPFPYASGYASAKAGVLSFTEAIAAEAGEFGVKVFAITPGRVRTAMLEWMTESPQGRRWLAAQPAGQELPAELAGDLVLFLASGGADALSGRFIHVLDGVEALATRAREIQRDDLYVMRLRT